MQKFGKYASQFENMQKYAKNAKILCENQEIFNFSIYFEVYSA